MLRWPSSDICGYTSFLGVALISVASTPGVEFSQTHIAFSHSRGFSMCSLGRAGSHPDPRSGSSQQTAVSNMLGVDNRFDSSSRPL